MEFWQGFEHGAATAPGEAAALATMPDGSALRLPLRDYGSIAVTGLIANQASFTVTRRLAFWMADAAAPFMPEIVVGLPTLGQVFAPLVAEALGHPQWVAAGYSEKLWYEARLSVPLASSTAPTSRRLWLDPRVVHRLAGRRVLLVDDVISTGTSARAGVALLAAAGVAPVACCVAMAQGNRWRAEWPITPPLVAAFATPLFGRTAQGWAALPGTCADDLALGRSA